MDKLKSGVEFIFSSYKRTASVLFVAALVLAIPFTISLLGQQQDIRQRASSAFYCDYRAIKMALCSRSQLGTMVSYDYNSYSNCNVIPENCTQYLGNDSWNMPSECAAPSGGWCPIATPSPAQTSDLSSSPTPSPSNCNWWDNIFGGCATPTPEWATPTPENWISKTPSPTPSPSDSPVLCTQDAKICPDGSSVGRVGPACEFAPCPTTPATPTPTFTQSPTRTYCIQCAAPPDGCVYEGTSCSTCGTLVCATPTATLIPTATPAPAATNIAVSITLQGIGTGAASLGLNDNPIHPQRGIQLAFYDAKNEEIPDQVANTNAQNTARLLTYMHKYFSGILPLWPSFTTGAYTVKIRTDNSLWKTLPGIQFIGSQTITNLPLTQLVTGDISPQDNEINLSDYTGLLSCLTGNASCTPDLKQRADLNDDGTIDELDLNIMLSGFANRSGD